jgi:hypothetical protein
MMLGTDSSKVRDPPCGESVASLWCRLCCLVVGRMMWLAGICQHPCVFCGGMWDHAVAPPISSCPTKGPPLAAILHFELLLQCHYAVPVACMVQAYLGSALAIAWVA